MTPETCTYPVPTSRNISSQRNNPVRPRSFLRCFPAWIVSIHTRAFNIHYFFDTPNHSAANLAYWSNPPAIQKVDIRFTPVGHPYTHSDPSFTDNLRRTSVLYLSSTMVPQNYTTHPVSIRPYGHIPDRPENHYPFYRTLIDFFMKIPVTWLYFSFIDPPGFPVSREQYADTFFEVVSWGDGARCRRRG